MKQNRWIIKYRSLTYIYLIRSIYVSHWSIIPTMMLTHQIILKILSKITRTWNIGHVDLYLLWDQSLGHTVSLSENMTHMHQIVLEIQDKITGPWNIGHIDLHLFWGQMLGHTEVRSNFRSYWLIISNNDVHTLNCLQDIRQNNWTTKYRLIFFIFRSNVRSYRFILPKYDVYKSNSLQDIKQNHWTMKYRSYWPSLHDHKFTSQGWAMSDQLSA